MKRAAKSQSQARPVRARKNYQSAAQQYVDPSGSSGVLIPDKVIVGRAVRRFQKVITIKATDPGCAGGFTFVTQPSLRVPAMYTGGATVLPAAAPGPINGVGSWRCDKTAKMLSNQLKCEDLTGVIAMVQQSTITHTVAYPAWYLHNTAMGDATSMILNISSVGDTGDCSVKLDIKYALTADAAWTTLSSTTISVATSMNVNLGNVTFDHLAIVVTDTGGKEHQLRLKLSCLASALAQISAVATTDLGSGVIVQTLDTSNGGRLVGMSVLATNTSAALSRGGMIYVARMPRDITPFSDHTNISNSLAVNRYHIGTADEGGYAWWFPNDEQERTYDTLANMEDHLSDSNYLYVKVIGWNADSTFKVTISYVVEFYIESALYEKIQPPISTPEWEDVCAVLQTLPASSCNPAHELFRKAVNKAASVAHAASQHYSDHKALYDGLLTALLAVTG